MINYTVQPELLVVQADRLFINRELILGDGRDWLEIAFMNPI